MVCSGNAGHYDWLIGWLAYCVQHPGKQAEVAVVLRGLKGTGKGMVGQMLMRIFRDHSLHITNSKHLVGNFNAHLVDALFLFLDEAFWAGDKQGEGTLKALITERTLMIEPKGVDSFQMPNRLKILMASQQRLGGAGIGRRAALLRAGRARHPQGRQGLLQQARARRSRATSWRRSSTTCCELDLAGFDHRNPPHTEGLNKQKLIGGRELRPRTGTTASTAGYLLGTGEDDWPEDVVCEVLHAGYVEHAHQHGDRHPLTIEQLGVRLRKLSPGEVPDQPAPQAVERHDQAVALHAASPGRAPRRVPRGHEDRPRRPRVAGGGRAERVTAWGAGVAALRQASRGNRAIRPDVAAAWTGRTSLWSGRPVWSGRTGRPTR